MSNNPVRQLLDKIFKQGAHGDHNTYFSWCKMYIQMASIGLPDNLRDFEEHFHNAVTKPLSQVATSLGNIQASDVEAEIKTMLDDGLIEQIEPYHEYRLKQQSDWVFAGQDYDFFFAGNELSQEPLHFIRSRSQNFYEYRGLDREVSEELVIAMTEAAENAIKYSDRLPIIVHHGFTDSEYEMKVYNSCYDTDLNDEIERGKFSEQVSLMRGVLVMSKLLDDLSLNRDQNRSRVEFIGRKKLS